VDCQGLCEPLVGCGGGGSDVGIGSNIKGLEINSAALIATLATLPIESLSDAEKDSLVAGVFQNTTLVYQDLLKGSRNHLRSFVSNLANQGVAYVPQYMAEADYLAIVTSPMER